MQEPYQLSEAVESVYQVSKPEIARMADRFIKHILQVGNHFEVVENLTALKEFIKQIEASDALNELIVDDLAKEQGKKQMPSGTKIEKIEASSKYDYSKCGDTELPELQRKMEEIKRQIKHREDFLKASPVAGCPIVVDGGEVITIYPPTKSSTTTYKITLAAKEPIADFSKDDLPF